jgi:hypothetical protein
MPIPQAQLETWSSQGSITQSKNTYAAVKAALEDAKAKYTNRNFKVFLQGSYGNDTNIFAESDVDIVIRYDGSFFRDLQLLPAEQLAAYNNYYDAPDYPYSDFKAHVHQALKTAFGASVTPGQRAFNISAGGGRRSADVIVAFEYRRYYKFNSQFDENYDTGIGFLTSSYDLIANYPNQHSKNCTTKHQATGNEFKPLVRIFKNMRTRLLKDGLIAKGGAPSYFIEGLLYNVPDDKFAGNYQNIVYNILSWLEKTPDRSKFLCANEQYYLLFENSSVCWPKADGEKFINAAIKLWNDWS